MLQVILGSSVNISSTLYLKGKTQGTPNFALPSLLLKFNQNQMTRKINNAQKVSKGPMRRSHEGNQWEEWAKSNVFVSKTCPQRLLYRRVWLSSRFQTAARCIPSSSLSSLENLKIQTIQLLKIHGERPERRSTAIASPFFFSGKNGLWVI